MNGKALLTSLPATTVEEMSEDVPSLTGGRRISLGESQVGRKRFAWCIFVDVQIGSSTPVGRQVGA